MSIAINGNRGLVKIEFLRQNLHAGGEPFISNRRVGHVAASSSSSRYATQAFECFSLPSAGRRYLFDPTELAPRNQVMRIGAGRDATHVAFAIFGTAQMTQMSPKVRILEESIEAARRCRAGQVRASCFRA